MIPQHLRDFRNRIARAVGARIREAAARKGLAFAAICKETGITQATIQNYLNGKTLPDLCILTILSGILGEEASWFLTGKKVVSEAEMQEALKARDEEIAVQRSKAERLEGQVEVLKELLEKKGA